MILLDEQIPDSQRRRLLDWGFHVWQIGWDIGHAGMDDVGQVLPFAAFFAPTDLFHLGLRLLPSSLLPRALLPRRLGCRRHASGRVCAKVSASPFVSDEAKADGKGGAAEFKGNSLVDKGSNERVASPMDIRGSSQSGRG
ncbi:MAG: hypothetical protein SLRJCFUN_002474 [Candidatus Fervidibacter sp.]